MSSIETLVHSKSGASVKIHPYGATILSFVDETGRENLFVSKLAKLDGSAPIRGGIPLVFPIFGPPSSEPASTMPQHGFARNNVWTVGSKYDHDEVAGITFTLALKDVMNGRGDNNMWSAQQAAVDGTDCVLTYEILLNGKSLTTTLSVENTGSDAFNLQMLQHTYLKVDNEAALDPSLTYIEGLEYYDIIDKVDPGNSGKHETDKVVLSPTTLTDKIFLHSDPSRHTIKVHVGVGGPKKILLESMGQLNESPAMVSCVVWNPHADKAATMADFDNDEYKSMICVEPGMIGHQPLLAPGKKAQLTQILQVE